MTLTERRPRIRVLIADDNRSFRKGLRLRLEQAEGIMVVGEAATGRDAVLAARAERADVVLMDLEMPGVNGVDATRILTSAEDRKVGVVVLTSHSADAHVLRALESGANGYLLKSHDTYQLLEAIRAAHRGDAVMSPRVTAPVLRELARRHDVRTQSPVKELLSPSERRVIVVLTSGVTTNDEIAAQLGVSVNTVRSHIQSAMRKVGAGDRTQLALWGVRNSIDDFSPSSKRTSASHPNE
ncbi:MULTISPECIES: response regulator transcription factor [Microbacterium]|uniref:Response regulator transcription factor n=1 Tax=Microbacterium wangchenii TaxID=2541726 RepID=A0ABX5SVI5_9MICO|nr:MULTISPECIES: response regulator transcription factor [Microbacterium]MCK6068509.1 response regulator transcription factor [Microbacterium sp. EYE_512]QBR89143.1 response regulator transcription factor [Microbacterium wangchenii]TXK09225.1 response regulator transcription factor [Microbacterium wangchenii]